MKKTTGMVIVCILLLLASGLYYFLKDEPLPAAPPAEEPKAQEASTLSYVGNSITEEKDGKRLWELKAETIEIDSNTNNAQMKNVTGTFYQDKGGTIEIKAPEAFLDNKTKDITMPVKMEATSSDGGTFSANEARWSGKEQQFYGSGNIVVTKDDTVITGDKIESDTTMKKVKVYGNAKVIKGGPSR
jgi:LPS export ABC transporter protein LptC